MNNSNDIAALLDQRIARMKQMEQQKLIEANGGSKPPAPQSPQIETKPVAVHTPDFRRI